METKEILDYQPIESEPLQTKLGKFFNWVEIAFYVSTLFFFSANFVEFPLWLRSIIYWHQANTLFFCCLSLVLGLKVFFIRKNIVASDLNRDIRKIIFWGWLGQSLIFFVLMLVYLALFLSSDINGYNLIARFVLGLAVIIGFVLVFVSTVRLLILVRGDTLLQGHKTFVINIALRLAMCLSYFVIIALLATYLVKREY